MSSKVLKEQSRPTMEVFVFHLKRPTPEFVVGKEPIILKGALIKITKHRVQRQRLESGNTEKLLNR